MKRTLVDLEESSVRELDELAKSQGTSRAVLLRSAVAEYLIKRERVPTANPTPLEGFGVLAGKLGDGLAYQESTRSEWE